MRVNCMRAGRKVRVDSPSRGRTLINKGGSPSRQLPQLLINLHHYIEILPTGPPQKLGTSLLLIIINMVV
jgi:hypothetical protein